MAIDEFCKQLARANSGALAQWLFDVSGVGGLTGGEFLGVGDDFGDGHAPTAATAAATTGVATAGVATAVVVSLPPEKDRSPQRFTGS